MVGESGSGKSVLARAIMGLLPHRICAPARAAILLEGEDLLHATPARMREIRCSRISMIFQEPMTALNPVKTIGAQIDEVLELHTRIAAARARLERIVAMLESVRLSDPQRLVAPIRTRSPAGSASAR